MDCRLEGTRSVPHHVGRQGDPQERGVFIMPFPLIPMVLGVCFFLIWLFIGGMIFRDGQLTAHRDR